jgi:hypothetical protein
MKRFVKARVGGPLELHAAGFRVELARMGYTAGSTEHHMYAMAHLSKWLSMRDWSQPTSTRTGCGGFSLSCGWAAGVCRPKVR